MEIVKYRATSLRARLVAAVAGVGTGAMVAVGSAFAQSTPPTSDSIASGVTSQLTDVGGNIAGIIVAGFAGLGLVALAMVGWKLVKRLIKSVV